MDSQLRQCASIHRHTTRCHVCHCRQNHWRTHRLPTCMCRSTSSIYFLTGDQRRILHHLARAHSRSHQQVHHRTSSHDQRPPRSARIFQHHLARTHSRSHQQVPRRTSSHDQRPPRSAAKEYTVDQTKSKTQIQKVIQIPRNSRNSCRTTANHPQGMMQPHLSHLHRNNWSNLL